MARKPMDLPTGLEVRNGKIRIRFRWHGKRYSESLIHPATQAGIAAASRLRDQVTTLIKLGLMDDLKYAELFPLSAMPMPPLDKALVNTRSSGWTAETSLKAPAITTNRR